MALDCEVVCRPRFPAIRGVRPGLHAPLFAAMLSTLTRSQSIRSASPSRSSTTRCKRSQMPACCQSRSRRQQVTPDPQPISWGSNSQRRPALRTKIMPVKQARSGIRGRPPFGFGDSGEAAARRWPRAHPGRGGCSSRRIVDRTVSWLTPKSAARERRLLLSARERRLLLSARERIADSSACESFRCRRA